MQVRPIVFELRSKLASEVMAPLDHVPQSDAKYVAVGLVHPGVPAGMVMSNWPSVALRNSPLGSRMVNTSARTQFGFVLKKLMREFGMSLFITRLPVPQSRQTLRLEQTHC